MESDVGQRIVKFDPSMSKENPEVVSDSPVLNATVDNVIDMFKTHEEEMRELEQKKRNLEADINHLRTVKKYLELEKTELDGEITRLKLRNITYQKEHTSLRNSITLARFQIAKIKESIAVAKANDLEALEEFENAVDEITKKFRSGPVTYDRRLLLEKIEKETEKKEILKKKLEEVTKLYDEFNTVNSLRARADDSEDLIGCILPESSLSRFVEMTKTLDDVISGIKNLTEEVQERGKKF